MAFGRLFWVLGAILALAVPAAAGEAEDMLMLLNEHRTKYGMPPLKPSKALTKVANEHVKDLPAIAPESCPGLRSWKEENPWWRSPCCDNGQPDLPCMRSKARELSACMDNQYTGDVYELIMPASWASEALNAWKDSPATNAVLLNSTLRSVGIAYGGFNWVMSVWFGDQETEREEMTYDPIQQHMTPAGHCCDLTCSSCDVDGPLRCSSCHDGRYLLDEEGAGKGTCEKCTNGCGTCVNAASCLTCDVGMKKIGDRCCFNGCTDCPLGQPRECLDCAEGYYADGTACRGCSATCKTCSIDAITCDVCADGLFKHSGGCCQQSCASCNPNNGSICATCPPRYYKNAAQQCVPCGPGCAECEDITGTCTKCLQDDPSRPLVLTQDKSCCPRDCTACHQWPGYYCTDCLPAMFWNRTAERCLFCPEGCESCQQDGTCTLCTNGLVLRANGNSSTCCHPSCTACNVGQILYSQCLACSPMLELRDGLSPAACVPTPDLTPRNVKAFPRLRGARVYFEMNGEEVAAALKLNYELEARNEKATSGQQQTQQYWITESPASLTELAQGGDFTFRVRAFVDAGGSDWSDWSNPVAPLWDVYPRDVTVNGRAELSEEYGRITETAVSRRQFEDRFYADVSKALDVGTSRLRITALEPLPNGSTLVRFEILPPAADSDEPSPGLLARLFEVQMEDPQSELRKSATGGEIVTAYMETQAVPPEDFDLMPIIIIGGAVLGGLLLVLLLRRIGGPQYFPMELFTVGLGMFDLATDVLFAFDMLNRDMPQYAIPAFGFIALPLLVNLFLLFRLINKELATPEFAKYADQRRTPLVALMIFSATNLECMMLTRSGLCGAKLFNAPWSAKALSKLSFYGLTNALLEDIPQLILQSIVASDTGSITNTQSISIFATTIMILFAISKRVFGRLVDSALLKMENGGGEGGVESGNGSAVNVKPIELGVLGTPTTHERELQQMEEAGEQA